MCFRENFGWKELVQVNSCEREEMYTWPWSCPRLTFDTQCLVYVEFFNSFNLSVLSQLSIFQACVARRVHAKVHFPVAITFLIQHHFRSRSQDRVTMLIVGHLKCMIDSTPRYELFIFFYDSVLIQLKRCNC